MEETNPQTRKIRTYQIPLLIASVMLAPTALARGFLDSKMVGYKSKNGDKRDSIVPRNLEEMVDQRFPDVISAYYKTPLNNRGLDGGVKIERKPDRIELYFRVIQENENKLFEFKERMEGGNRCYSEYAYDFKKGEKEYDEGERDVNVPTITSVITDLFDGKNIDGSKVYFWGKRDKDNPLIATLNLKAQRDKKLKGMYLEAKTSGEGAKVKGVQAFMAPVRNTVFPVAIDVDYKVNVPGVKGFLFSLTGKPSEATLRGILVPSLPKEMFKRPD